MALTVIVILFFVFATQSINSEICLANQKETWSYDGVNGPPFWGFRYPSCNGLQQSPINIDTRETGCHDELKSMEYVNYDKPIWTANVVNSGHSVQIIPTDGIRRINRNGGLLDAYDLAGIHFHWGSERKRGSQHLINWRSFEMEMSLLHNSTKNTYSTVGVFFEESAFDNPDLEPLVDILKFIQYRDDQTTLKSALYLEKLLPCDREWFYRYTGSFPIPPCTEGVEWSVLAQPVPIGTAQIQEFRRLRSTRESEGPDRQCFLVDNIRPVQSLNGRIVTSTKKTR